MSILQDILDDKQDEVAQHQKSQPLSELKDLIGTIKPCRGFKQSLLKPIGDLALIAEVKKASPSKGIIRPEFEPVDIALIYQSSGASALSILTDEKYFQGSLQILQQVRSAVELPLLRKDFVIDEYQIYEARAYGADAILLIVAALSPSQLQEFSEIAKFLGMDVIVETHTQPEMLIALDCGADIIGINNRDLRTFQVDLEVTESLAPMISEGCVVVSESGIQEHEDVLRVKKAGAHAVLVGESLMRAEDIGDKIRGLIGLK